MNYAEALTYLDSFINLERGALDRSARAVISLHPVLELAGRLGNPQNSFASIHVAGTKGKGSTCAFAERILRAAGLKTGLYTSPHLQDVRERIQLNGEWISEVDFARGLTLLQPILDDRRNLPVGQRRPTYFEILTHLAFWFFAEQKVDVAVLEVGLGGRLDATNIVTPVACGITNISYDHQAILGDTLDLIAREKAGIVKRGVPVVVANHAQNRQEALDAIADVAGNVGAPVLSKHRVDVQHGVCRVHLEDGRSFSATLPLKGSYQPLNWAVAVQLADIAHQRVRGKPISQEAVEAGTRAVEWPGRLELFIVDGVRLYLDGAHNEESVQGTLQSLAGQVADGKLVVLFACARDKNIDAMLRCIGNDTSVREILFTQVDNVRANDASDLLTRWTALSKKPARVVPCEHAQEEAIKLAGKQGAVLALGSLYLVGALRNKLALNNKLQNEYDVHGDPATYGESN